MRVSTPIRSRRRIPIASSWKLAKQLVRKNWDGKTVGVAEAVPLRSPGRPVGVGVVELIQEERDPTELVLDRADPEIRVALEHAGEHEVGQRPSHGEVLVHEDRRGDVGDIERGTSGLGVAAIGAHMEAQRHGELGRAQAQNAS